MGGLHKVQTVEGIMYSWRRSISPRRLMRINSNCWSQEAQWELWIGGERVVRKDEPGEVLYVLVAGNAKVHVE